MDKKLGKGKIKIGEETVITLYRGRSKKGFSVKSI